MWHPPPKSVVDVTSTTIRGQAGAGQAAGRVRRRAGQAGAMWRAKPGVCQVAPVPVIAKAA